MLRILSGLLLGVALAGCSNAVTPTPVATPTAVPAPTPNASASAVSYVGHVDAAVAAIVAKLATPAANDSDRLAVYSAVSNLTTAEASWTATQLVPSCLTTAASQYQSTLSALQSTMGLGVNAFTVADQAAMTQAISEAAKGRAALTVAQDAVDAAAATC